MKTTQVKLGDRSYPINFNSNLLKDIHLFLKDKDQGQKWIIISQYRLMELYGFDLLKKLKQHDFNIDYITLPIGEAAKSLNEYSRVISQMIEMKCDRSSTILALGGGVVGDLSGFVASSFMRGIEYFQIPTTLLAMVDSSIGGKTGINIAEGKNLVGSIYQPQGVLIDPLLLRSLPKEELISGLGEVIKYGAIHDASFLKQISDWLNNIDSFPFDLAVQRASEIKAEIVSLDEKETGLRRLLNFGHTIGHALEAHLGYGKIRHGEAVALGMKSAAWISNRLGLLKDEESLLLFEIINKLSLPAILNKDPDRILSYVKKDKKIRNGVLHFVVLNELGKGNTSDQVTDRLIEESLKVL